MIHCRRGSVCLRVCLVILMCYISLSAVVYERFRRAKQYLKQHYRNIKEILIYLCTRESFEIKLSTISAARTHSQCLPHSKSREHLEADYKWWASLLLASLTIGFLDSCVHHLVSLLVQFCKHSCVSLSVFYVFLISQSLDSWSMCYIYVNVLAKTAYLFLKAHNAVLARFTVPTYSPHFLALRQAMPTAALKYSQN